MEPSDLHRLGYSPLWVEFGLLTGRELRQQLAALDKGEDPHPEHYRYKTFRHYILGEPLTAGKIKNIFAIISVDPDPGLALSMANDLLKIRELPDEDFLLVTDLMFSQFGPTVKRYIDAAKARRSKK